MKSLETVNAILCILSFAIFFCALILDFRDHANGSIVRRTVFIFMMLGTCSLLIRVGEDQVKHAIVIWFLVALAMFTSKLLQYKGKTRQLDDKLNRIGHSFKKHSSSRKRAAH